MPLCRTPFNQSADIAVTDTRFNKNGLDSSFDKVVNQFGDFLDARFRFGTHTLDGSDFDTECPAEIRKCVMRRDKHATVFGNGSGFFTAVRQQLAHATGVLRGSCSVLLGAGRINFSE